MKQTDQEDDEQLIISGSLNLGFQKTGFKEVGRIDIPDYFFNRIKTGTEQLDSLFGEGFVRGTTFTITAEAGTGKTTLMLQALESIAHFHKLKVGYVSGEESIYQLSYTSKRINVKKVRVANMTLVEDVVEAIAGFDFLIVDAFQCLQTTNPEIKTKRKLEEYAITNILQAAKDQGCVVGFICHLTKMGKIKGSTLIPHAVDMNIEMEKGDPEAFGTDQARVISISKNRFGPTGDIVLHMATNGFDFETEVNRVVVQGKESRSSARAMANDITKQMLTQYLEENGSMTVQQGCALTSFDDLKLKRYMRELTIKGVCEVDGRGAGTVWTYCRQ